MLDRELDNYARVDAIPDIPGDIGSQAELLVDGQAASTVDAAGDEDWFRVELLAGQVYRFDLRSNVDSASPLGDPYLRLFDSFGNFITASDDSGSLDSRLFFSTSDNAVYFASAGGLGDTIGDYLLSARTVDLSNDVPGDLSTQAALTIGGEVTGAVEISYDQDWFRVDLTAGQIYRFDLAPDDGAGAPLTDTAVSIYDGNGVPLDQRFGTVFYHAPATGVFFASAGSYSDGIGDYRLSARLIDLSNDVPGDPNTLAALAVGAEVTGTVDIPDDQDWYRVDLTAGQVYRFGILPNGANGVPQGNLVVRIYDTAGVLLDERPDTLFFGAPGTGSFLVAAGAYYGTVGDYSLSAQVIDLSDDVPGDPGTLAALAVGSEVAGSVDIPGDQDWYRLELTAGQVYRLDLLADDSAGAPLGDLAVRVFDGNGLLLSERSGTSYFQPETDGIYFAAAGTFGEAVGDYRLTAQLLEITDSVPDSTATGSALAPGGEVASSLDFQGDVD
jgi:hypothetical protein